MTVWPEVLSGAHALLAVAVGAEIAEESRIHMLGDRWDSAHFWRLCREADARRPRVRPRHTERPTPGVTVEAVRQAVRDRGISALNEPNTRERLRRCDNAAISEIDRWLCKQGMSR
jgi:hypothetical protein